MDSKTDLESADQGELEEEAPPGPIRRVFGTISTVFWWLVILAAILFAWPSHWGGPLTITQVQGHSMEPTFYTGDIALAIRNYQNEYEVGDIIVYNVDMGDLQGMVIHRIVEKLPNGNYISQGDNKPAPDPWEIKPEWVMGKVDFSVSGGARWLALVKSPVFIAIMAGALVAWVLWPRSEELDGDEADKEDEEVKREGPES